MYIIRFCGKILSISGKLENVLNQGLKNAYYSTHFSRKGTIKYHFQFVHIPKALKMTP